MSTTIPEQRLRYFLYFIRKQRGWFTVFFFTCFATALSSCIWPYITGKIVDALSSYQGDRLLIFGELRSLFLYALGFWIFLEVFMRSQGLVAALIYPKFEANVRMALFEHVNKHSHTYFSNNFVGSIANRISDLPKSSTLVIDFLFNNLIPLLIAIVISSALFMKLHVDLGLVLSGWLTMHILICFLAGRKAAELSRVHSEARTGLLGRIVDTLNNHLNVKLYTKHYFEVENVRTAQEEELNKNRATLFYIEKMRLCLGVLAMVSITLLLYLTIRFWQAGKISLGDMIFIFTLVLNVLTLAWSVTQEMAFVFRELGVVKQALKIVRDPIDVVDDETAKELRVSKGKIEFIKVTFKYKHNDNVFLEKTLTIDGGQKVGLVGLSGSGKTTFAHLLLRLFNIESGCIKIDGQDIKEITLKSLRDNICLIPQEPMLFHRSIIENIRYSSEDATDEEVIEASIRANCHEFIMNLEDGYDTLVGEKAAKISGGQKQRIAIARALLKDAPVLIMDEATSALDSYTEKQIQESIKMLSKNKTTIIIAHRLSTLLEMDRILVFDNGTIVEDGTHEELLARGEHYAMLWRMQTAGLLPDSLKTSGSN